MWRINLSIFLQSLCKIQIYNLQVHYQFFSVTGLKYIVLSITVFLSYHSTVVLYIIHIWCYPLIYHDYLTQDNHHLNVIPAPSSYSNTFSIFPSCDCINFLGYYPFYLIGWKKPCSHKNSLMSIRKICYRLFFFVLILNGPMGLLI